MPARMVSSTSVWVILSVAVTVAFGLFGFVWSILEGQISDVKNELKWSYATKDFVIGKIDGIKDEEQTYRKGIEKILDKK